LTLAWMAVRSDHSNYTALSTVTIPITQSSTMRENYFGKNGRRVGKALAVKLGIKQGGMHGFRDGRVSFPVENNTPVEVIEAWIGHG